MDMENNNKKLCKYCKSEIPEGAKICPNCRKKQGKSGCLTGIIVVVVLFLLVAIFGSSGDDKESTPATSTQVSSSSSGENVSSEENNNEAAEETEDIEEKEYYTVGDVIDDNGVLIKILSAGKYVSDNQFLQPEDGKIYYKVDFEFENTSDSEESISSIVSFDAYEDGYSISQSYVSDETVDGTIAPGKKLTGSLIYELNEGWQELEIDYETNIFSNKKIVMKFFNQ